jgi:hypothetical protein
MKVILEVNERLGIAILRTEGGRGMWTAIQTSVIAVAKSDLERSIHKRLDHCWGVGSP